MSLFQKQIFFDQKRRSNTVFQLNAQLYTYLLSFLIILIFSSCSFAPRYRRPCMEMPNEWRVTSDESLTCANVKWWQQLEDPILDALIQEALENNKDLKLATARIKEYQAQLGIVSSQLYPQLSEQTTFSRQRFSQSLFPLPNNSKTSNGNYNTSQNGDADLVGGILPQFSFSPYFNNYLTTLNISYEIDLWGKIRNATDAAFADLLAQVDARRSVILSVVSSVANAYIQLRQYELQLQISLQTLKSRQNSYDLAVLRFEEGLTSELEVKQAASEREEAAIQVIQFQTLIPQQENLLSVLIGHPPAAIQAGQSLENWQLPLQVPSGLPVDLLEQRPDISQAEKQVIAANFRIGEAKAFYFPDLNLTGYYGYESSSLRNLLSDPSRVWQWLLNIIQPIFTGGRISNMVNLAEAVKNETVYQYLQIVLQALQEVNDALIAHKNAKRALEVERQRVQDLKDYLRLAELQYQNGLVDYLNVLDAQRRLFGAQLDLAKNQGLVFITLVDIYKALGGGWVIDAENTMQGDCPTNPVSTALPFI